MPRTFTLADMLTVTTGKLMSSIDGVYQICDFVTGESNFTHQLGRVANDIKPYILWQHPVLQEIDLENVEINPENHAEVLKGHEEKYGSTFEVKSLSEMGVEYKGQDPMEELASMVDPSKIIVLNIGEDPEKP